MKKTIKDVFEIAGHKIDFSAVGYSLKDLPRKLSSLVRGKTLDQIEKTVYDSLRENWNGIESGSKEFVCYQEQDGRLCPYHVEAGRGIQFYPCVFILKCNLFMAAGKNIYFRIKIDKTGQTYNSNLYGVTYEYKVSELFVCDELGNSLLGFSQMPFPMDPKKLKSLFLSLTRASGKVSLTKEDEGNVSKNVYESWIRHGMLTDSERPPIKDTARHLTFETGLQTKDGRNVQVILWKDAATDDMYEFRVVMGMSSILDQNEEDEFDSRPAPAKPTISLPVSREISISGAVVVKDLALKLGVRPNRLVADLMSLKILTSANQRIEPEAAIKVAQKYGYKLKVEHARDAVNKKPLLKSVDTDDEIPQGNPENIRSRLASTSVGETVDDVVASPTSLTKGNPTYLFGPNVGGAIVAATQALKNEQYQTESVNMPTVTEKEFLERFIGFVRACGYQYDTRDLIRFHTCAKCGFFTLLGGEPGTGKSSLALLYAKAIAGDAYKDKEQFLRVDVNPGWMEPADLMGYYSSSANAFLESEVGLVSFLGNAEKATGPRMVCFEEMNLAYVEHYFSDFIQQMSRAKGDRTVAIKKKRETCESISLKDNLRFFGTINFDETTKELSARFYDRCNYIELSPAGKTFPRLHSSVKNDILCKGDEIPSKVFNEWVDNAWEGKIDGWIMDLLDKVYPTLQSLHIAPNWRKACDIYRYIASRPPFRAVESKNNDDEVRLQEYSESGKEIFNREVLDEVIVQSIIPVYRRPNEFLEEAQSKLLNYLQNNKLELSKNMFARIIKENEVPYPDEP